MSATSSAKKRKVDIERRAFNPAWNEQYFFYGALWTAQCLICLKTVAVLKEFNMRRHWEAEHRASTFRSMSPAERKDALDRLSGNLQKTTSFFRKQTAEADKIVRASYGVSRILARWMKPFSDGDFIKECHVAVVDSVCPEQRSVFETVSLSSRIGHLRKAGFTLRTPYVRNRNAQTNLRISRARVGAFTLHA